ncbi:DUF1194 domain-containing protein [Alsobacter sp. SYSU M60028]|uniref:DUF1194 domain-containing protein n=1 Tax=Alsobacter ponti TaxID=2962936 RepID=A0ABT1LCV6_9HYPH|nr:DUF1194 domain-containing protein [Alsobacter ponti]MCP8938088.1 DUF1194 domain-containing protein [Alsobacter ponti]
MFHLASTVFSSRTHTGVRSALAGLAALAALLAASGRPALARDGSIEVDVELVLAVDISYSMDPEEQALQRQGYVEAFRSPVILDAISKGVNGRIAVAYMEWAGTGNQDVVVDWQVIDGIETAQEFAAKLAARPIRRLYRTSISGALDFAVSMFETNNYRGLKRVIDVSGDGSNNQGRPVTQARDDALAAGITINGLPIMLNRPNFGYPEVAHLDQYYTDCVIGGPAAFTIPIRERSQFVDAIRTKILLEVALAPQRERPHNVIPAQATPEAPSSSCTFGERSWQQRWGN